ncbi:hypothetical protein GDO81_027983 [Engystomops pustulosus]|uniref:Uncharacterized protein n=1 Tax=Engystomops pustulosus TaxID=76066 RepID=A0AAV6YKF0_ENGPU|nr:hypothetical protein GDO81_027983 [Engystomops pustulosus]
MFMLLNSTLKIVPGESRPLFYYLQPRYTSMEGPIHVWISGAGDLEGFGHIWKSNSLSVHLEALDEQCYRPITLNSLQPPSKC